MGKLMFAPTTEITDKNGNRVAVSHVVAGREVLSRNAGRIGTAVVEKITYAIGALAVTLVTSYGRRLTVEGGQRLFIKGKRGKPCWKRASALEVGTLVYVLSDGVFSVDRIVCTVMAEKAGEAWTSIVSSKGSLFAEEILCRAS